MPTSTLTYITEDIRNGWARAQADESTPTESPGTSVQYGTDGTLITRGLFTGDLADFDTIITPGSTIDAVRLIVANPVLPYTMTLTKIRVGLGDPWTGSALQTWRDIAAGTLDQNLNASAINALTDTFGTGLTTIPLSTNGIANMQSALDGAGLFWIGFQCTEVVVETVEFTNEDPWPSIEIDWTAPSSSRRHVKRSDC